MFGASRIDPFLNDVADWPLNAGWALFFAIQLAAEAIATPVADFLRGARRAVYDDEDDRADLLR
jgi:hypothetical protein